MGIDINTVVAGAGGAGLASALSASEGRKEVLVVEARTSFQKGCNTSLSGSVVPAADTPWQRAAGIDDSPDLFLRDVLAKTRGEAYLPVARALTRHSAEVVGWMADQQGVEFELVTDFLYPGYSVPRGHASPSRTGFAIHDQLMSRASSTPDIHFMVPARLTHVSRDADHLVVTLERPDGTPESLTTENLVLATNGFGAERSQLVRFIPEMVDAPYLGGDGSTGDAIRIAEHLELDLSCMTAYQGHGGVVMPHGVHVTWATIMQGAFIVNSDGHRFEDETIGYSEFASVIAKCEGRHAWLILDRRIYEATLKIQNFRELDEAGAIRWAESPEEIADLADISAEALRESLAVIADARSSARPDPFGRTHSEPPLDPPYGVVRIVGGLFHTQGGIAVDEQARVLSGGEVVHGLYAAGGAAVGMSGTTASGYMGGNGLLAAFGLGYLAGRQIAGSHANS